MLLLAVFSYCYRTCSSATDPTPTTSTGLGNPPQEQPYCQPCLKDGMGKPLQGRDCGFTTHQRKITSHTCKILCPLKTIKGKPGFTSKGQHEQHGQQSRQPRLKPHTITPSEFTHRVANRALSTTQSQDLGLSPLSQPACTPLLQAPLGARQYKPLISHWT